MFFFVDLLTGSEISLGKAFRFTKCVRIKNENRFCRAGKFSGCLGSLRILKNVPRSKLVAITLSGGGLFDLRRCRFNGSQSSIKNPTGTLRELVPPIPIPTQQIDNSTNSKYPSINPSLKCRPPVDISHDETCPSTQSLGSLFFKYEVNIAQNCGEASVWR